MLGARVVGVGERGVLTGHGSLGVHVGWGVPREGVLREGADLGIVRLANRGPLQGADEA